jgi:putative transcriptional regulator
MEASLRNQFLIAMPSLVDPTFAHTVTYLCEHNEHGALGIVINQPLDLSLGDLLRHLELECDDRFGSRPVMSGGPVQGDRGFVLHVSDAEAGFSSTLAISDAVSLTTSRDVLEAIAGGYGPARCLVALGYAGWGPGQLEEEMAANAWLTTDADTEILFELPFEDRAHAAAARLGIDLNLIASEYGNA